MGVFYWYEFYTKKHFINQIKKNLLDKHRNRNRDYKISHPEYSVLDLAKQLIFEDECYIEVSNDMVYDMPREYGDEIIIEDDLDF